MPIEKKYKSQICLDGKRISSMREIALTVFENSFLSIEIDDHQGIFIIRIDDKKADKKKEFEKKYKLCRIIVYKELDFSLL